VAILKNMKISGKLTFGFGLLVVILVFVAVFSIINMISNNNTVTNLRDYPTARLNNLKDMSVAVMDLRRVNANMTFRLGDPVALNGLMSLAESRFAEINALVATNDTSFRADTQIDPTRRDEALRDLAALQAMINEYETQVIRRMYAASIGGTVGDPQSRANVEHYLDLGASYTSQINVLLNGLIDFTQTTVENRTIEIDDATQSTIIVMIILAAVGAFLGIIIGVGISKMVSAPVGRLVDLVKDVATGNLNVNMNRAGLAKDEVGTLTSDMYNLIDIIKSITGDITTFSYETSVKGDIEYRINANKYQGGYNEMVVGLNGFADNFVKDMLTLIGIIDKVASGEFDFVLEKMPGKKAVLNEKVDFLKSTLDSMGDDIDRMIEAAAVKGDLEFHLDESKYKGGWRTLVADLNKFVEVVDQPIVEIRDVMGMLAQGDFSKTVTGNYAGDFLSIKNAVNNTIATLSSVISEVSTILSEISSGDLSHRIESNYVGEFSEIKTSINNISDTLRKAMGEINSASAYVLEGAKRITANAMELADGSQTQAASLEELNTSVELINIQTRQFADNAREANTLSNKSTTNAQEGNEAMKQMLSAMMQIKDSSSNISKIIRVIQDIAFQTNLLALNAAVEAARAGEHGKGFAVVAEEVRSLAARSQDAAAETTSLISDSITRVESGTDIAQVTSESLGSIVSSANEVLSLINNITTAANEQADMISQISSVLLTTATTVQNNSKFAQEAAATAEELNSQSEMLQQLVAYFRL